MLSENMEVALLSERLALSCGYSPAMAKMIKWAAEYHDVGKSQLPQNIIRKPGRLLPHEFEVMKQHTKYGETLLASIPGERGRVAKQVALMHHEWYNGQGYWGYKASSLPMFIGIVSVCDVYVALLAKRVYKRKWTENEAQQYINDRAGLQFCPNIVDTFNSIMKGCADCKCFA